MKTNEQELNTAIESVLAKLYNVNTRIKPPVSLDIDEDEEWAARDEDGKIVMCGGLESLKAIRDMARSMQP